MACPCLDLRLSIEHGVSGLLVPVGDIQGLAGALRELITRPQLAAALSAGAVKAGMRLDAKVVAAAHYRFCTSTMRH